MKIVNLLHFMDKCESKRVIPKKAGELFWEESTRGLLDQLAPSARPPGEEFCSIR